VEVVDVVVVVEDVVAVVVEDVVVGKVKLTGDITYRS
jgi:hypothetical protein